jgi:hypothetical protein
MSVKGFEAHLLEMLNIHKKKGEDYANEDDPLLNYHRQAEIMAWFESDQDKVWIGHLIQKVARLAILLNKHHRGEGTAANEPITDSFLDGTTIFNLWWCDYESRTGSK